MSVCVHHYLVIIKLTLRISQLFALWFILEVEITTNTEVCIANECIVQILGVIL